MLPCEVEMPLTGLRTPVEKTVNSYKARNSKLANQEYIHRRLNIQFLEYNSVE